MGCCDAGILAIGGTGLCCFGDDAGATTTDGFRRESLADRLIGERATIDRVDLQTAAGSHAWVLALLRRQ